ncbi:MAG: ABC transporter permease [Pricia sp.]
MFKNHFKIAWRNLKTNRLFSVINILGLSLGLAITMVLFLFIRNEQSFDSMYPNKERIERVLLHTDGDMGRETWANSPAALAPALMNDIPDIKFAARIASNNFGAKATVRVNNENFSENQLYWVDQELFDIFKVPILEGDMASALERPNTVVLSETTAKRYFGDESPLGKTIQVDGRNDLEITGVYQDFPGNSTLSCELMASFNTLTYFSEEPSWGNASFETYCLLKPNTNQASAERQIQQLLDKYQTEEEQWYSFSLQPLERIHLYSAGYSDANTTRIGDIDQIRNLSLLSFLILLIACINYMNLSTARSQKRSKEVGINKTLGASARNLVVRFYAETGLLTAIAIVLGIGIAIFALPFFNSITGQNLGATLMLNVEFVAALVFIWILTTLVAGSYPALYLSRFSPKAVLSPSYKQGKNNVYIRKGLVVLQFAASVILMVGILVVYQQIQFMNDQKLGFEPENVVAISIRGVRNYENRNSLLQEFRALNEVSTVSMAQGFPGMDVSGRALKKKDDDEGIDLKTNHADNATTEVLQMNFLAGGPLPENKQEGDTLTELVLNKKAVDYLGYSPEEAIGKEVDAQLPDARIVGVVDNFNFASLHVPIGAYAFHNSGREPLNYLLIRFNTRELGQTIKDFQNTFQKVVPEANFDYTFLDQNLAKLYEREQKTARVGILFCGLAIFVACLGLFGLAAFMAEQRKKEISIRKVLGASILNVTKMLSTDFVKLVLLALVIAFPIASWLTDRWLETFAYRTRIGWSVFIIAGLSALAIALLTVIFQSVRAALTNPAKSLRTE